MGAELTCFKVFIPKVKMSTGLTCFKGFTPKQFDDLIEMHVQEGYPIADEKREGTDKFVPPDSN